MDHAILASTEWNVLRAGPLAAEPLVAPRGRGAVSVGQAMRLALLGAPSFVTCLQVPEPAHA